MANRRQRKKQEKNQRRHTLESLGYTKKQQKNISDKEYKSIITNLDEKRKINEKYHLNLDYSEPVSKFRKQRAKINKQKKIEAENKKKQKRKEAQKRYNAKKKRLMEELGLSGSPSRYTIKQLEDLKDNQDPQGKVYTFPSYLYIGFADNAGEIDILETQEYLAPLSDEELKRYIGETKDYFTMGGSSGRSGDIIIFNQVTDKKYFVLTTVRKNEKKGYQTILSNQFTIRGAWVLLQALIENCREDQREYIIAKLSAYFRQVPEFYEIWKTAIE